ncbi:MAG: ABC transporter ATP-binding protein [Myxococcota bacterium]
MATVELDGVTKRFADGTEAVRALDLTVRDGERMVLVGPSGCGKSTTLRLVAGLERVTSGRVRIGGRDVTAQPARDRDVAMVFQSYALYPHKTVRENLAFPLRVRGVRRPAIEARVAEVAELLGLGELIDRRPAQLSGGQRQRVALGRAIVRQPQAFLLDEPLSNLDPALRLRMRAELIRLHRRLGTTLLHVTHDQEEALTLGDRLAVMHRGRIEQLDDPVEVYRRPATVFVAGFVGAPPMNLVPARWEDGHVRAGALAVPWNEARRAPDPGQALTLGVRPQDLSLVAPDEGVLEGRVELVEPLGHGALVHVQSTPPLRVRVPAEDLPRPGDRVGLRPSWEAVHLFDAEGRRC